LSKQKPEVVEKRVTVYQYEDNIQTKLLNNVYLSVAISITIGYILFAISG
jgi:hypothetical protein